MRKEEFIQLYNRTIDWNKDILETIDEEYEFESNFVKSNIEEFLSIEKITDSLFDIEHGIILDCGEYWEFQVFYYPSVSKVFLQLYKDETEEEYKKKRIETLTERNKWKREKIIRWIEVLKNELNEVNDFDLMIAPFGKKDVSNMDNADFLDEILRESKKMDMRLGQAVFTYIEDTYGIARVVKEVFDIDCYYKDDNVFPFIGMCWKVLKMRKNGNKTTTIQESV